MVEGLKIDCSTQLAKLVEMRLVEPNDLLPLAQLFDLEELISVCKTYASEMDVS